MAKQENVYWPSDEETKIVPVEIVDEVKNSMLQYSMSVLVGRAIPDVRDGLKPVHRRILYTMYKNGLTPDKAYRKCADTVGSVLGSYHPHGDASVYDAMVRMAQDFSLRYPLIDGHGNFGNIDGYPAAAYRYTESRMNRLSLHMLDDIEKETVDHMPTYDESSEEPTVLPCRFPNRSPSKAALRTHRQKRACGPHPERKPARKYLKEGILHQEKALQNPQRPSDPKRLRKHFAHSP